MHTIGLYQIHDTTADSTLGVILKCYRDGQAARIFQEILATPDKDNEVARYPKDFILLYIGQQDIETGALVSIPAKPVTVYTGQQHLDQLRRDQAEAYRRAASGAEAPAATAPEQPVELQVLRGEGERIPKEA